MVENSFYQVLRAAAWVFLAAEHTCRIGTQLLMWPGQPSYSQFPWISHHEKLTAQFRRLDHRVNFSTRKFQELITQLDTVHKVLLQVDQLRATNQLAQPIVNALLLTVNSANETMESSHIWIASKLEAQDLG